MDPRPLPKETTLRFVLILFVVLMASVAITESLWYTVYGDHAGAVLLQCSNAASTNGGFDSAAFARCQRSSEHERVLWTVAWAIAVLAVGTVAAMVASSVRRRRLTPVPLERMPAVGTLVSDVTAGGPSLTLLWQPKRPIGMARADGIVSPYVEVGPAFLSWSFGRPAAARAVLQHEYAHQRRHDVLPARVTWWCGYAFLLPVVPFAITVWDVGATTATTALARLAVAGALVAVSRAAVLRAREHDADLDAAFAQPEGIDDALGATPEVPAGWHRWLRPLAHHPARDERRQAVADPARTCSLRPSDAVMVGLAAALAGPALSRLWRGWFQYGEPALRSEMFGWGVVGMVLGAWLAAMVLRAVAGSRASGSPLHAVRFSWALAAAVLVGRYVFSSPLYLDVEPVPRTLLGIAASIALALGLVVVVLWLRGFTDPWLDTGLAERSPAWCARPIVLGGALVGGVVLGVLANLQQLAQQVEQTRVPGLEPNRPLTLVTVFITQLDAPLVTASIVVLAAAPIILVLLRPREGGRLPSWLSATAEDVAPRPSVASLSRWALAGGLVAGLASTAAFAVYTFGWDPVGSLDDRGWYASTTTAYASMGIAAGVVALSAAAVALVVTRAHLPLSALTAGVGTVVAAVGVTVVQSLDRGEVQAGDIDDVLVDIVTLAVIGALLVAALVVALRWGGTLRGPWRWLLVVVPVLSSIVLVGVGVQALTAMPSRQTDVDHFSFVFDLTRDDILLALGACVGREVTDSSITSAHRAQARLKNTASVPARPETRAVHAALLTVVDSCTRALDAVPIGSIVLPAVVDETNRELNRFVELGTAAGILAPS
jgi:hypothetical protein